LWGQTALLYAIKDSGEGIGIVESYRRGWHKILSFWWVSFLAGLIIMGGIFLLVVPGIIFMVWFSLAVFVLIAEDLKGMSALIKSKKYVKGRWGGVFWRLLFIGVLTFVITLVLGYILGLLNISLITKNSGLIVGLFLAPLAMAYSFSVYSNLRSLRGEIASAPAEGKGKSFIFIGILGVLIIPAIMLLITFSALNNARERSRDARRHSDVRQIQTGLELYYNEYGKYPSSLNELSIYLPSPPVDPSTNQPYQYQSQSNGANYKVCMQLESAKDQTCVTLNSNSLDLW